MGRRGKGDNLALLWLGSIQVTTIVGYGTLSQILVARGGSAFLFGHWILHGLRAIGSACVRFSRFHDDQISCAGDPVGEVAQHPDHRGAPLG